MRRRKGTRRTRDEGRANNGTDPRVTRFFNEAFILLARRQLVLFYWLNFIDAIWRYLALFGAI